MKAYAERAGLDPVQFAGHTLRSGFLTSAAEAGASVFKMMEVSAPQVVGYAPWLRPARRSVQRACGRGVPVEGDIEIDQPGSQPVFRPPDRAVGLDDVRS